MQAAEDTSSQIQDKIVYAEKAQDVEAARVRQLQGRVEEVKKTTSGDMDGVQGAGHAESMDMDDVRVCVCEFVCACVCLCPLPAFRPLYPPHTILALFSLL